jgi:hypothetical protein
MISLLSLNIVVIWLSAFLIPKALMDEWIITMLSILSVWIHNRFSHLLLVRYLVSSLVREEGLIISIAWCEGSSFGLVLAFYSLLFVMFLWKWNSTSALYFISEFKLNCVEDFFLMLLHLILLLLQLIKV